MIKKYLNYFLILIFSLLIDLCCVSAIECNYSILECVSEKGYLHESNLDYSINSDCQFIIDQGNDKIKLDSYNSGTSSFYNGGDEDLENWDNKNYCPNTIRRTSAPWYDFFDDVEWYGYEDLQSARDSVKAYDYIFILDTYLQELKKSATEFDSTVSYTCQYDNFSIDFNKDGYALSAKSTLDISASVGYFEYDLSKSMTQTKSINPGECENVYYCLSNSAISTYTANSYLIFVDEFDYESNKDACQDSLLVGQIHSGAGEYNNYCRTYSTYMNNLKLLWQNCKNNVSSCVEYNQLKSEISTLCKSLTQYAKYGESDCLSSCLNYSTDISNIEKLTTSSGECGLSSNLIKWIKNILKWIKYILPVLVIILGIIDFIRAIASGSDDEMKKAQGRFIKRLIAAALLFIIPALIEFILNVFNIESTFCGLTD